MFYYQNFKASHRARQSFVAYSKRLRNSYKGLSEISYTPPTPPTRQDSLDPSDLARDLLLSQKRARPPTMESQYIRNLLRFEPKFYGGGSSTSVWHKLPAARRSAVLVLLFQGRQGELRVILTKRSRKLRNFSGHVSFPGGKVDNGLESEFMCARRETEEEIGISRSNEHLAQQFGCEIEHMKVLPSYMARTLLGVAPCVGFLHWNSIKAAQFEEQTIGTMELNPGESSSVFSVPLRDFLQPMPEGVEMQECLKQSYVKTKWAGIPWDLRQFIFPIHNSNEVKWLADVEDLSSSSDESHDETQDDQEFDIRTHNCWGLTANILHDLAEIMYHSKTDRVFGEEELIWSLLQHGEMKQRERSEFEKKLIRNTKGCSFKERIGQADFDTLKTLYSKKT